VTVEIALYAGFEDNEPGPVTLEWPHLAAVLTDFPPAVCDTVRCVGKHCTFKSSHPCWSPVTILPGKTRNKDHVQTVNAIVVDLDHHDEAALAAALEAIDGFAAVIHSTHSHAPPNDGAYRLVMHVSRPMTPTEYEMVRREVIKAGNLKADPHCSDAARLYARPDSRIGTPTYARILDGEPIDVDFVLANVEATPSPTSATATTATPPKTGSSKLDDPTHRAGAIQAIAKHFPPLATDGNGQRNKFALNLGGVMRRHSHLDAARARTFAEEAFTAAGSKNPKARAQSVVDSYTRIEAGRPATGIPELQKLVGDAAAKEIVDAISDDKNWIHDFKRDHGEPAPFGKDADEDDPLPRNTDIGRAARFARDHSGDLRYLMDREVWLRWSGQRWQAAGKVDLQSFAKRTARRMLAEAYKLNDEMQADAIKYALKSSSAYAISAMIELAASEPAFRCSQAELDQHPQLLTCTNGVVDLHDGSLRAHDRADYLTTLTPIAYNPNARAPRWEQFLSEVFADDQELIKFVRRAAGYSLTGYTREHAFFVLHGSGRNGKGRFIRQLMALVGDGARTTAFSTFTTGRFAEGERNTPSLAALAGARLVVAGEPDEGVRLSESVIKSLTGDDEVQACAKYERPFTFTPGFKLWLHTNYRPEIRGTDDGIWRRPRLIPFNVTFDENRADRTLDGKLDAEREGILQWAVAGAVEWFRDGLGTCKKVKDATEGYRTESDPISSFVEECIETKKDAFITSAAMYATYQRWCERNGTEPWRGQTLSKRLIARGLKSYSQNHMRGFAGVALRS
jgi:putative DNA primase/helicase